MKIRSNFVSNSSSSSFILNATGQTSSIRKVARMMIKTIIKNSYEEETDYYENANLNDVDNFLKERDEWLDRKERDLKEKNEWLERLEELDENQPVFFPSCNYDTWIVKVADNILISTCNNENWELPERVHLSNEAKAELLKIADGDPEKEERVEGIINEPTDFYGLYILFDNFYALPYKIIGTEHPNWDVRCTKHKWEGMWITKNRGLVCPICISERRDKLEQIEKHSEE